MAPIIHMFRTTRVTIYVLTWILGVVSKQLRLLHGRVGDSTTSVNSLSPQMSELVEDAIASWCGDIVGQFWPIRNELLKFVELKFEFFSFNTFECNVDICDCSLKHKQTVGISILPNSIRKSQFWKREMLCYTCYISVEIFVCGWGGGRREQYWL